MVGAAWEKFFGETPPLGHELRRAASDRWFRIHSLPESKRYPETDREWNILLDRHRSVSDSVLSSDRECWTILSPYSASHPCFTSLSPKPLGDLPKPFDDDATFLGVPFAWDFDTVAPIIGAIANDEARALFFDSEAGSVYAPYDGGADMILPDTIERDRVKQRFRSWLSPRRDGL